MRGIIIVLILFSLLAQNSYAGEMEQEIDHLLHFVKSTTCQLIRNGRRYPGNEAAEHIINKYRYFRTDIASTEKFIELSASKSTISGQPYWVICQGHQTETSGSWLRRELYHYRKKQPQ